MDKHNIKEKLKQFESIYGITVVEPARRNNQEKNHVLFIVNNEKRISYTVFSEKNVEHGEQLLQYCNNHCQKYNREVVFKIDPNKSLSYLQKSTENNTIITMSFSENYRNNDVLIEVCFEDKNRGIDQLKCPILIKNIHCESDNYCKKRDYTIGNNTGRGAGYNHVGSLQGI